VDTWLEENAIWLSMALAGLAAVLLVLFLVFLILWARSSRQRRRSDAARVTAERDRLETESLLQEEVGRLRIIRELHEVAVHSVSVIISQADGARYAGDKDPSAAVRSAGVIADTARSTLADLRRVMTVVRSGEAEAAPQPRLKMVRDLVKVMREAGLVIDLVETGDRFDLREGAELAIFRILQEALSNAMKYGGEGTEVRVSFTWTDQGLQLLVDDDGVRSAARRQGLDPNEVAQSRGYTLDEDLSALTEVVSGPGITEMRERAALFGGLFHAYSVPGVGFSVSAVFPALKYDNGVHGVNLDS
jgi:signal transduction histidine kinase